MNALLRWTAAFLPVLIVGMVMGGKNAVRNGDFEKFSGNEPSNWETTNLGKMLTVVSPSSNAHGGSLAVKCEVKNSFGSPMAGMIIQKNIPLSGEDVQVSLYYLLSPVGKDVGFLAVDFENDEGSTVGMCQHYLTAAEPKYTLFKAVTKLPEKTTHCEMRLTLMPEEEGGKLHEGSSILLDDISLVSLSAQIDTSTRH